MPKIFVRKTYDRWIKKNRHRFNYSPWISKSRKDVFTLRFIGIAPQITCEIRKNGGLMFVHDNCGEYWDIVGWFDVFEERTASGEYYCGLDIPPAVLYATRTKLWEDDVFERMLSWINEIPPDAYICLYGSVGDSKVGGWWADIIPRSSAIKDTEFLHARFPAISTIGNPPALPGDPKSLTVPHDRRQSSIEK